MVYFRNGETRTPLAFQTHKKNVGIVRIISNKFGNFLRCKVANENSNIITSDVLTPVYRYLVDVTWINENNLYILKTNLIHIIHRPNPLFTELSKKQEHERNNSQPYNCKQPNFNFAFDEFYQLSSSLVILPMRMV
uniref:Uncharacterized protein n=1 Tax=Rhizophagus irregularis (strain DAOM 181602 / DAOM 197198 / MUCL 43194) TaxID=747089 RepID=U9TIZ1_RHIID